MYKYKQEDQKLVNFERWPYTDLGGPGTNRSIFSFVKQVHSGGPINMQVHYGGT